MDTDIKPAASSEQSQPLAPPAAAATSQVMDVVTPPKADDAPVAAEPAPTDPSVTTRSTGEQAQNPAAEAVKTEAPEKPAEKPVNQKTPSQPKQPSTLPMGAIIGATVVFLVLAVVAYFAYSKG